MFESLTNKLQDIFDQLAQRGRLTAEDVDKALREVRLALLEADVSLSVVKAFIKRHKEKATRDAGAGVVIIDTAGRLQIDDRLMSELEAIKARTKPEEVLLVADAMTGQEAVKIAEGFNQRVGLTGLILSKMDGDARGGAAISM